jgi:hypothetical protein
MRIDLIPERDRFIPGWHIQPEPCRAEEFPPEWRWPRRPLGVARILLNYLLRAFYAANRHTERATVPRHTGTTTNAQ